MSSALTLVPPRTISSPPKTLGQEAEAIQLSLLEPALFAEHWLGVELWWLQREILTAITQHHKVAVKACHSSSKTFSAAVATLWWLARYEEATVITTAPTANQVEKLLWSEIGKMVGQSLYPFPSPTLTQLRISPKRFAVGFTTNVENANQGVNFQGFHNRNVLVILDEAPGIAGSLWEAVEGILSSGNTRLLALGNPIISSGPFYDAFGANRETWATYSISAFDTPNLTGIYLSYKDGQSKEQVVGDPNGKNLLDLTPDELSYSPTPYLISRQWVKDRYLEWGPLHPLFVSRVLGQFPSQAPGSLISLEWLLAAKARKAYQPSRKLNAGIDVAGPGEDETTLVVRDGPAIILSRAWPDPDPRGEIVAALTPFKFRLENVNVDTIGIGYYLARHLEDLKFPVSDINVGESSSDPERYSNKKAEFYWALRMRAETGDLLGVSDDVAIAQLAGIRYKTNARGQIQIESKDDARKRGVKSPDRAEGVMLAFAPSQTHGLIQYWEELATMNREKVVTPQPQETEPGSLAEAQKAALPSEYQEHFGTKVAGVKTLGKVQVGENTQPRCSSCGSPFVTRLAERRWRCNGCGMTGVGDKIKGDPG